MPPIKPPPTETHAERQARENAALLSEIIEAGGIVYFEPDGGAGQRLAIRFDLMESPKAIQFFIRFKSCQRSTLLDAATSLGLT